MDYNVLKLIYQVHLHMMFSGLSDENRSEFEIADSFYYLYFLIHLNSYLILTKVHLFLIHHLYCVYLTLFY